MTMQQTPLYQMRNGVETLHMGVEWDDVTLAVENFAFRLDTGNRSATFTLTRLSDSAQITHQFVPGANYVAGTVMRWNPAFGLSMQAFVNVKSGQTGLVSGWGADLALDANA